MLQPWHHPHSHLPIIQLAPVRLTLLELFLWVGLLLLLFLFGFFVIVAVIAAGVVCLAAGLVALLLRFARLLVLLVHLGLGVRLLVGTRHGRLGAATTLDWGLGIGRGVGERLPGIGEEVGETHGQNSGAIGRYGATDGGVNDGWETVAWIGAGRDVSRK